MLVIKEKGKEAYKIDLLENKPGTKMYIAVSTRRKDEFYIEEVEYAGYTYKMVSRSYYEPKMIAPAYWDEPEFTVSFKTVDKKQPITLVCRWFGDIDGSRGFSGDEHLECGVVKIKGVKGFGDSFCIDAYFTTDIEKFKNYVSELIADKDSIETGFEKRRLRIESEYKKEIAALNKEEKKYKKMLALAGKF